MPSIVVLGARNLGGAIGIAGLGYAITIAVGSPMLDYLGMGNLLSLSAVCFMIGTLVVIFGGIYGGIY